jgi:hypothetical protein
MSATVVSQTAGHCELIINAVKVDLIRERMPLSLPLRVVTTETATFQMADPIDIGRMKLFSIASRGSRKDFIDLYCLTHSVLPLNELLNLVFEEQKGLRFNPLLFLKGLIDFEEAERDAQPILLWDLTWENVKTNLTEEVKRIARKWS